MINEISDFPDKFVTVLDDYHVINYQPIHDAMVFLIDHLPANLHLVITTRVDPPLLLARLRANDQLTEIRANDLRFTGDEAAEFLNQIMGFSLTAEEVGILDSRTEGWIAGLQIAALSMQGRTDIKGFIIYTSILEELCGPLCDAVTEDGGSQAMLERIERANLFIIPLDNDGKWYRYHNLHSVSTTLKNGRNSPRRSRHQVWILTLILKEKCTHSKR
jgi:LuxR family maltose regulon positive regulatory protein